MQVLAWSKRGEVAEVMAEVPWGVGGGEERGSRGEHRKGLGGFQDHTTVGVLIGAHDSVAGARAGEWRRAACKEEPNEGGVERCRATLLNVHRTPCCLPDPSVRRRAQRIEERAQDRELRVRQRRYLLLLGAHLDTSVAGLAPLFVPGASLASWKSARGAARAWIQPEPDATIRLFPRTDQDLADALAHALQALDWPNSVLSPPILCLPERPPPTGRGPETSS